MVEFGWTNPILIDENAGILVGHGRLLAARKLGLADVPVIRFEHLSDGRGGFCFVEPPLPVKPPVHRPAGVQERGGGEARAGPRAAERSAPRLRFALAPGTGRLPGAAPAVRRLPGPGARGAGDRGRPVVPHRGDQRLFWDEATGRRPASPVTTPRPRARAAGADLRRPPGGGHLSTGTACRDRPGRRPFMPAKFGRGVSGGSCGGTAEFPTRRARRFIATL